MKATTLVTTMPLFQTQTLAVGVSVKDLAFPLGSVMSSFLT